MGAIVLNWSVWTSSIFLFLDKIPQIPFINLSHKHYTCPTISCLSQNNDSSQYEHKTQLAVVVAVQTSSKKFLLYVRGAHNAAREPHEASACHWFGSRMIFSAFNKIRVSEQNI
jgi:hypothetical protein